MNLAAWNSAAAGSTRRHCERVPPARASGVKGSVNGEVPWFRSTPRPSSYATLDPGLPRRLAGLHHRSCTGPATASAWCRTLAPIRARFAARWIALPASWAYQTASRYRLVSGSRRVVLKAGQPDSFHGGTFRDEATAVWAWRLHPGEVVYGEIVGYSAPGSPIMATHSPASSSLASVKGYGWPIVYHYGQPDGLCRFYCYRIVQHRPDGSELELTWEQMAARCGKAGHRDGAAAGLRRGLPAWLDGSVDVGGQGGGSLRQRDRAGVHPL